MIGWETCLGNDMTLNKSSLSTVVTGKLSLDVVPTILAQTQQTAFYPVTVNFDCGLKL